MSPLPGVSITKTTGGLGRKAPSQDAIAGIIMGGVTTTGYDTLGEVAKVNSLKAAEDLGFTEQYDTDNNVLVHYHISEIFRMNPDLNELYIMLVTQKTDVAGVSLADMLDINNDFATKMIQEAQGRIRQLAVALNPEASYVPTVTNGIDDDSEAAIAKGEELYGQEVANFRPFHIIIEGRAFGGSATGVVDLRLQTSPHVSMTIAQDPGQAGIDSDHAAVGTVLGAVSRAKVNESIGWVEVFNLVDEAQDRWTSVNMSSNTSLDSFTSDDLDTLHDKGFIFARTYVGNDGVYFNGAPTCEAVDNDFAWIQDNRTIDKALRLIYAALLPKVNSPQLVDPDSGQLDVAVVKHFESVGEAALDPMGRDDEISDRDVFVDPEQDVLATAEIVVEFELIPTGTARTIKAQLGFKNPFNS